MRRIAEWSALVAILGLAAAARLWQLSAGVPHAVGIDEPIVVDRALRILHTGDWNPHIFNYPTLVIYLQAGVDIVRFLWGALQGEWASLDRFDIAAVYQAGRFVAALIGVATIWLTYELGAELADRRLGLLAALQMALRPMHVRESHFVLTDVPMTAFVTLALWLALRAARLGTARAYAWAGAVCGLAAASKYNGAVVFVAVLAAWLLNEWTSPDRARKLAAAGGACAAGFLIAAPHTLLDLPAFLDGFAALSAHFTGPNGAGDPVWEIYAKHLWLDAPIGLVLALLAVPLVLVRRAQRPRWLPIVVFGAAYFYVLSTHSHVFGRYALPLLPILCLLSSAAVLELPALASRVRVLAGRPAQGALVAAAVLALAIGPAVASVRWLDQLKRPDTRATAAAWLRVSAPKGARVAVENSGPTYLAAGGFAVVPVELLFEHDPAWYRQRADYLVVSSADLTRYTELLSAGPTVFQIAPTPQRWGPPIRIVSLRSAAP